MGVGRRFLDLARGNLNSLLERAARSELEARSDDELRAELQRRRSSENAQLDERQRADAMEAAAKARGEKRAKAEPPEKRGSSPARGLGRAHRLRALHAELGCRPGASHDELKSAYRALMRKHHPDHHAGDPVAQKRASERAASITTAYAELEALLESP